jgi:hypothetical protein
MSRSMTGALPGALQSDGDISPAASSSSQLHVMPTQKPHDVDQQGKQVHNQPAAVRF